MTATPLQKVSVLIVDDEKLIQRLVYDVLMQLGFRDVMVAHSGRQAIDLISEHPYDFIITDWRMGDMDGIDVIRFVRSAASPCPRVPIIMLTGNTEAYYVTAARDAGVNEYLAKPFTADQLVKRIRAIIEKPRSFVEAPTYKGPERRHRDQPRTGGDERRKRRRK